MTSRHPLVVEVYRGPLVESRHNVMAVVIDEHGRIANFFGNTDYLVYPRSSIKMLQAIPFVESGALEKFGLGDKELALACSSHKGERQHLEVAAQWMNKLKIVDSAFSCGLSWPGDEATQFDMIRNRVPQQRVCHNCSGKHLGMISTSLALGEKFEGYHKWDHPVQVRLRTLMTELTKIDHEKTPSGIDGCGIPTYAIPLDRLAMAMGHLISRSASSPLGAGGGPARKAAVDRIVRACRAYPELLGGSDEFISRVNEKSKGRVVLKAGAEGTYAGFCPEQGVSFALKAQDGAKRAAEAAIGFLLRELHWISDQESHDLQSGLNPVIKNSRGESVGEIRVHKDV